MNRSHGGFWRCKNLQCINTRQYVKSEGNIGFRQIAKGMFAFGIKVAEQAETPIGCLVPFRERKICEKD